MAEEYIFQLQVSGPDLSDTFVLPPGVTTVGRQSGNELRLPAPGVSRRHAQFDCSATACTLTDLGSANGTFVNGEALEQGVPRTLSNGDAIQIDNFSLAFEEIPVAPAEPEPPREKPSKPKPKPEKPTAEKEEKPAPKKEEPEAKKEEPARQKKEAGKAQKGDKKPPPPSEPPPSFVTPPPPQPEYDKAPPGLSKVDSRYLDYLPGVYRTDFMKRFLAMFESIMAPIEWTVDNFDLYLSPGTAPTDFLPWLSTWYDLELDDSWDEAQRRAFLTEAHQLFARRGTRWALSRMLEIYTGRAPEIDDQSDDLDPFTFVVKLPVRASDVDRELVERIIDANKPAHTSYELKFK